MITVMHCAMRVQLKAIAGIELELIAELERPLYCVLFCSLVVRGGSVGGQLLSGALLHDFG